MQKLLPAFWLNSLEVERHAASGKRGYCINWRPCHVFHDAAQCACAEGMPELVWNGWNYEISGSELIWACCSSSANVGLKISKWLQKRTANLATLSTGKCKHENCLYVNEQNLTFCPIEHISFFLWHARCTSDRNTMRFTHLFVLEVTWPSRTVYELSLSTMYVLHLACLQCWNKEIPCAKQLGHHSVMSDNAAELLEQENWLTSTAHCGIGQVPQIRI